MTKTAVKISVIMPVYNAEQYINGAVEMIQSQSLQNWELIFVDDASVDSTSDLIRKIQTSEPRILYAANKKNMGPSFSRNRAIAMATGEWIAIVDADDFINEERLEKMIGWGDKFDLEMVGDNQVWVDAGNGDFLRNLFNDNFIASPYELITINKYLDSVSKIQPRYTYGMVQPIIKRDFLAVNNIKYNVKIRFGEDTVLHFDCLMHGAKFGVFQEALYTCRKRNKKSAKHTKITVKNQRIINKHFWKSVSERKEYHLLLKVIQRELAMQIRRIKQLATDNLR